MRQCNFQLAHYWRSFAPLQSNALRSAALAQSAPVRHLSGAPLAPLTLRVRFQRTAQIHGAAQQKGENGDQTTLQV